MTRKQSRRIVRAAWKAVGMKPRKPIPKVSPRRQKDNAVYARKKKAFLRSHHRCAGCGYFQREGDRELHHWAGRAGKLFLEDGIWLMLCSFCHSWVHRKPMDAIKDGLLAPKGCWNDYKRAMAARPEVRK